MRNYYNTGGPTLVGKQKKFTSELKKKILAAKKEKDMKTAKKTKITKNETMGIA